MGFTHCVKVDLGSRGRFCLVPVAVGRISHIFIVEVDSLLRSILPCPGGCRTNFTHFHCGGGLALEVDSGYTFMLQSTIDYIFLMKVDSDPDGELPHDWQLGFCRILLHFSHSVRMDVSAHF